MKTRPFWTNGTLKLLKKLSIYKIRRYKGKKIRQMFRYSNFQSFVSIFEMSDLFERSVFLVVLNLIFQIFRVHPKIANFHIFKCSDFTYCPRCSTVLKLLDCKIFNIYRSSRFLYLPDFQIMQKFISFLYWRRHAA